MTSPSECDGSVADATAHLKNLSLPKSELARAANDNGKVVVNVDSLPPFDIRPPLRVDLSCFTVDSKSPPSVFSSLTPLSTPALFPSSTTLNPFDLGNKLATSHESPSQLNSSPSTSVRLVRPGLRHSHFSSFRGESVPESDPHDGEEVPSDSKDDPGLAAYRGWQIARRLHDAALSEWESQRILPVSNCSRSFQNLSSPHGSSTCNGFRVSPHPI